jgi:transposase-like protein
MRRSTQVKLQIARETLQAQASVAAIARRHGINANQVFGWLQNDQLWEIVQLTFVPEDLLINPKSLPFHVQIAVPLEYE